MAFTQQDLMTIISVLPKEQQLQVIRIARKLVETQSTPAAAVE